MDNKATAAPRILFVCLGNICRSPMAEGVFRAAAKSAGLDVTVDSAGTSDFHEGNAPDRRAQATLRAKSIDISKLRARQVGEADFAEFDYMIAMDANNLGDLQRLAPPDYQGAIKLFLDYAPHESVREIPDPYFGKDDGFEAVYRLIVQASGGLLAEIQNKAANSPT